jgi:hypothetical protein
MNLNPETYPWIVFTFVYLTVIICVYRWRTCVEELSTLGYIKEAGIATIWLPLLLVAICKEIFRKENK